MNRLEFIDFISQRDSISKKHAEDIINTVFEGVIDALILEDKLVISGFGTFEIRNRSGRVVRDISSGDNIVVRPSKTLAFKPSSRVKGVFNSEA